MISIENKTAMRTFMNANRQVFRDKFTTARALLRCAARINSWRQPTSTFSLVARKIHELTPSGISNTFVHTVPVVVLHLLNIQILEGDDLKLVHQSPAEFMCKVFASISYALINMLKDTLVLAVFWRIFGTPTQSALCSC